MLNSSVTGFCFESKLSDNLFFLVATRENCRPLQKFVTASLETVREDPTIRTLQKSMTTGYLETTQRNL